MVEMDNLIIGTRGWQHSGWIGSFYPEDMPEDWRLDYYSNVLSCVLIAEAEWSTWDDEWLEEVKDILEDEAFFFYFEVSSFGLVNRLEKIKSVLQEQARGVLVLDDSSDRWKGALTHYDITYLADSPLVEGWSWQSGHQYLSGSPLGWLKELPVDGKEQAALLTQFMTSLPEGQNGAPFIVGGDDVDMAQIRNLKVIAEISGF